MMSFLLMLLAVFHVVLFGYFILLNTYYLVVSLFAFKALRRHSQRLHSFDVNDLITSAGAPPITLMVPAYNEAGTCVASLQSFLTLQYPEYEILVINDGSTDDTLAVLQEAFELVPAPRFPTAQLETAAVERVYQSLQHPNLWLIDKANGGKSDAINAGLNFCRTPLFCTTDADSIIEPDALARVARPFLEDSRTVASGGIIRVANGCTVEAGLVRDVRLPDKMLARFQVLEYLRAFLSGRVGWDALHIVFLISGAFGLFKRQLFVEMGGFDADSLGDDLEATIRIHRHCRENNIPYRVTFVPDPVVWTDVPESIRVLGSQRNRWHRTLIDSMLKHRKMLFNPRYGRIGMVAYPYFFFMEMLGPVVEMLGYVAFAITFSLGLVSVPFAIIFLLLGVALGMVLSAVSVGLEELSFRRYGSTRDLLRLVGLAFVENLGYRQLMAFHCAWGVLSYLRGSTSWGSITGGGFRDAP